MGRLACRWACLAIGLGLIACDGEPAPADAGDDASASEDAGISIAAPVAPSFTPCPPGWREMTADGVTTCDPFPEGGARSDCADDEAHFPGEPGCSRVGTACPADGWPEGLPAGGSILYVRSGAAPGGDGSTRDAPLATVGEALALATSGTVVAVAEGTYDEAIVLGAGVTVWGACVARTILTSSVPDTRNGVVGLGGEGSVLRNLSIRGAARPGILSEVLSGVSLRIEDIVVADVTMLGIALDGGRLEGRSVVVRDVAVDPESGSFGRGIGASSATVELDRVVIERTASNAIFAGGEGCVYTLTHASVRDVYSRRDGELGRGATAQTGARLVLDRVVIERAREVGIASLNPGTMIVLRDVVVRDTVGRDDGGFGVGVLVDSGGAATAERLVVERSRRHGISAAGMRTSFEGTDVLVRDTSGERVSGAQGGGVVVFESASATLRETLVLRSRQVGIGAGGVDSTLSLRDVTVREVASEVASGRFGIGIWAQLFAVVEGQRVVVEASRMAGVGAVSTATMTLEDARVIDVQSAECAATTCPEEAAAMGAVAHIQGGHVRMTRFEIRDAALCGVAVGRGDDGLLDLGGEMDLVDGVIARSPVGACVQVDAFDTSRLRMDVRYEDVEVPLQATSYALPESLPPPP